jgi:uncharacterized protein (DUF111 family)
MLPEGYETDSVVQLETNLDDVTAETLGHVSERLRESGALDVWLTPIQMKKHRPGVLLAILCERDKVEILSNLVFRETGAFGLRISEVTRLKLRRDFIDVETIYGPITVKRGFRGTELLQLAPEFESCRALSIASGQPLQRIYDAARNAATRLYPPLP